MTTSRSTAPRPPTGRQYLLRCGGAVARVGSVAAVLREFSVDGVRYTETWPDDAPPPMAAGIVLAPWPNRVAGASWIWQGVRQDLDITDRAHGHAIHGLARFTDYAEVDHSEDSVTLGTVIPPQHGWPFTLSVSVGYALDDSGLTVTHAVTNVGAGAAVFGCGAHPYLRVGEVPTDQLTLRVRAGAVLVTDERLIPVDTAPLTGALAGLPDGVGLAGLDLDTGFTDLEVGQSGRYEHVLSAPDGRSVTLWADRDFRYAVVFTPEAFPDDPGRAVAKPGVHRAVAVEPMTCPTDALNSGEGLISLAPGETWSASWGLTPGALPAQNSDARRVVQRSGHRG